MRLAECDGKALLRRHGVALPRGVLLRAAAPPPTAVAEWRGHVLKAQILEGGRGKRGLVRNLDGLGALPATRAAIFAALGGDDTVPLLLEEALEIAREIYLALRIDGTAQALELMVAPRGGEEVETGGSVTRIPVDLASGPDKLYPALTRVFSPDLAGRLARFAARLPDIACREDLELLEINPLVLTADGRLVACDAKIVIDDSAGFRHDPDDFPLSRMLERRALSVLEREAHDLGFQLVEMEGDVALITSGAGLGMMMIDLLAEQGLTAASFMDNLRGAPDETMAERLSIARRIATRPGIKAIVFFTVLASRSLAERIEALLDFVNAEPLPKPLFVGIAAGHAATRKMSAEDAVARLAAAGIAAFTDPLALVQAVGKAIGARA